LTTDQERTNTMQSIRSFVPRKPRKRPAPSQRDQEIYVEYQITGRRQAELAEKHRLTQSRVSQIIRRVAAWRASADAREEGELPVAQRQHLDRWLEYERLNFVCREAMHHFGTQQKHIAHKHGQRDEKHFDETTERLLPPSLQCLKILLAANAQLSKLEQKPHLSFRDPDEQQRRVILFEELQRLRKEAEREGRVTPTHGPRSVADAWLRALVGEPNDSRRPDPAARELSQAILPQCDRSSESRESEPGEEGSDAGECAPGADSFDEAPNPASTAHRSTYEPAATSPQPAAGQELVDHSPAEQNPSSIPLGVAGAGEGPISREKAEAFQKLEQQWRNPPPPVPLLPGQKPRTPFEDPVERRRRHFMRREDMRAALRRGLPQNFTFYPEDGPMPGPPPYILDGAPPPTGRGDG
jgi:hypothetical protein